MRVVSLCAINRVKYVQSRVDVSICYWVHVFVLYLYVRVLTQWVWASGSDILYCSVLPPI